MRSSIVLIVLACALPQAAFGQETNSDQPMLIYSWHGVDGCRGNAPSPAFVVSNFPAEARTLSLALTQGQRELGGGETLLPPNGQIPAGAFRVRTPCNEGLYRWTAILKSQGGAGLATIHSDRHFPEHER
jgi:hypothetical protein